MGILFEKSRIKSVAPENRFLRSATWMAMAADDGACTPLLTDTYARLADGGIGLIIAGFCFVSPEGKGPAGMAGMHSDHVVDGFRQMVDRVHFKGGMIAAQLAHCGAKSSPLPGSGEPLGPSDVVLENGTVTVRALKAVEIDRIAGDFAAAAVRAREIGYDAVQLHFAHGYLGSQFLSPYYNKRTDDYGGPIENRVRFLLEVYDRTRRAVGDDFPVMAKLNVEDFLDEGLTQEEGLFAAERLDEAGIDLIEVSGGTADSGRLGPARALKTRDDEVYFFENAMAVKSRISAPVAIVGGIRRLEDAAMLVEDYGLDYVSLSRPFLSEPHLVKRWKSGDTAPARCISCSRCFRSFTKGRGIFCAKFENTQKESEIQS